MTNAGPSVETRRERKEQTRRAILAAALELADAESLAAVSPRQVARSVGIVPTAFYRHFESLDELGLALVEDSFASLREMMRDVRRGVTEVTGIIEGSVTVLVAHVHQHGDRQHFRFIARGRWCWSRWRSCCSGRGRWPLPSTTC